MSPTIRQLDSGPIKVIEGHPVRLSCEVSGVPAPTLRWFRSNSSSIADASSGRASPVTGSYLDFPDGVRMNDRGNYVCLAENEAGSEQQEVFLDVIG